MGWKRPAANLIGRSLKIYLVRYGHVGIYLERDHLRRFLPRANVDCVFDVGANDGQYAEMIRGVGYGGPIISFEPIPASAATLRRKAARDPCWFVEEVALDLVERQLSFNIMADSQFSSLKAPSHSEVELFRAKNSVAESIILTTARLETYFDKYQQQIGFSRPFLKMDTQGNDLDVARGAGGRLSRFVGVQSELAFKRLYESQPDYREEIDFYQSQGFELSAFVPNNGGHFPQLIEADCIMFNPAMFPAHPV